MECDELLQRTGIPALDIMGWVEKPSYDQAMHRLLWAILARERGAAAEASAVINHNTKKLGFPALIGILFLKFWKLGIAVKLFRRKDAAGL